MLPYDSGPHVLDTIWAFASAKARHYGWRRSSSDAGSVSLAVDHVVRLSPTELQTLLSALQERVSATQHLITRVEAALRTVGC